jgi:uncharacterized C2H2 Zn-finger protein
MKMTNGSVNGKYVSINNCPRCKGAVFKYRSWPVFDSLNGLFQCFQCSRIYRLNKNGNFELWVRNVNRGEVRGMVKHGFKRLSKAPLVKKW